LRWGSGAAGSRHRATSSRSRLSAFNHRGRACQDGVQTGQGHRHPLSVKKEQASVTTTNGVGLAERGAFRPVARPSSFLVLGLVTTVLAAGAIREFPRFRIILCFDHVPLALWSVASLAGLGTLFFLGTSYAQAEVLVLGESGVQRMDHDR